MIPTASTRATNLDKNNHVANLWMLPTCNCVCTAKRLFWAPCITNLKQNLYYTATAFTGKFLCSREYGLKLCTVNRKLLTRKRKENRIYQEIACFNGYCFLLIWFCSVHCRVSWNFYEKKRSCHMHVNRISEVGLCLNGLPARIQKEENTRGKGRKLKISPAQQQCRVATRISGLGFWVRNM
jgi:hypothetical protein